MGNFHYQSTLNTYGDKSTAILYFENAKKMKRPNNGCFLQRMSHLFPLTARDESTEGEVVVCNLFMYVTINYGTYFTACFKN